MNKKACHLFCYLTLALTNYVESHENLTTNSVYDRLNDKSINSVQSLSFSIKNINASLADKIEIPAQDSSPHVSVSFSDGSSSPIIRKIIINRSEGLLYSYPDHLYITYSEYDQGLKIKQIKVDSLGKVSRFNLNKHISKNISSTAHITDSITTQIDETSSMPKLLINKINSINNSDFFSK